MKNLILTFLFFIIPLSTSCASPPTEEPKKGEAESKQTSSIPVHFGMPRWLGGKGQLYVDPTEAQEKLSLDSMSPMEYLIFKMGKWFTWLAGIAALGIIAGVVLIYLNKSYFAGALPFGKDVMLISAIVLLGSLGVIFFLNYIYWIAGVVLACVTTYIGWMLYRMKKTYDDKLKNEKIVVTKDKVIEELVKTGEVMKGATEWGVKEKFDVQSIQSDETIDHVTNVQKKIKTQAIG